MTLIDLLWIVPVAITGLLAVVVLLVTVPASIALVGGLIAQALGVSKHVPYTYNLRNLLVRWKTNALTAVAFTLVVALLTVMLAFVNGMYHLTSNSGDPRNVFVMADGALDEQFSNLGVDADTKELELQPGVARDADNKPITSWELYGVVNQPILQRKCPTCSKMVGVDKTTKRKLAPHGEPTCPGSDSSIGKKVVGRMISVRGIDDPARSGLVHNLRLKSGNWFSQGGNAPIPGSTKGEQAIEAVLGAGFARELGKDLDKPSLEVGDVFDLHDNKWIVAGIMDSAGSMFDSEVWAKWQRVNHVFGKQAYTTAILRTASPEDAEKLAAHLKTGFKKVAVTALTEPAYYATLNATNQQFLYATIVVMAIMAVGSAFGVMNTMFAAISQRTKDIGVMRIIGYSRWQILTSFFMEALLLAVVGGLVGCALGSLVHGLSATSNVSGGQGGGKSVVIMLVVDSRVLMTGMGFALFMGCVGGLLPALSAMRLRPLESLR